MTPLDWVILAALLAGLAFLEWVDSRDLAAKTIDRLRVRLSRRVPPGRHRVDGELGIRFGHPDWLLILRVPLRLAGEADPVRYAGATDESTRFRVRDAEADVDGFLEAYDDGVQPLVVQVDEPGRIAEMTIGEAASAVDSLTKE